MLKTAVKLAALAGVVGVGLLFVIQAQRGMNQPVTQQQDRSTEPKLDAPDFSSQETMQLAFSEGVVPIEQSEPVFEDEAIFDDSDQLQNQDKFDARYQPTQDNRKAEMQSDLVDDNFLPAENGLDFSDSGNQILQTGLGESETKDSPNESTTVLAEDDTSEEPRALFEISPSDSSEAVIQPEFDTPRAVSSEPLYSESAETPGDSLTSPDENDAEMPGDLFPDLDGSSDDETPGDSIPALTAGIEEETPGDSVSSSLGEVTAETAGDSVPASVGTLDAESPGDSVLPTEVKDDSEISSGDIPDVTMPLLSENGSSPFGTSDAVTSSEVDAPKETQETHPLLKVPDQSNPFDSPQISERTPDDAAPQESGFDPLKQAHPLNDELPSPIISDSSNTTDDFFPADEIRTDGLQEGKETEAFSPETAETDTSRVPSEEKSTFDPELNPVPTTNPETVESVQPKAFPETTSPLIIPNGEENSLTEKQASPSEPQQQDNSESPFVLELGNGPKGNQKNVPNPFEITSDAVPLISNTLPSENKEENQSIPPAAQPPQLNIEKVAPKNVVLGEPMIYSIIVQNMGNFPVHQVMVVDRIPKGTELMGTIPQAELDENRLIWKIGTFQPKEKRKILVRITPRQVGQIGSVATVHFFSEAAADINLKKSDLKLTVSGPSQARLGEPVVYRFKVTNTGTKDAKQVFIRDILPEALTHPGGKDLEYSVGTLPPGKSEEIELTLTAKTPGTTTNSAVVTAEGGVKIEKSISLKIVASSLIISRTGPKEASVNQQTTAINLVTNDSNSPLENITVTESVPRGMRFIEANYGGRFDSVAKKVEWSIARLGPKQSMELKVKLVPTMVGTQTSVVQAVSLDGTSVEISSQMKTRSPVALNIDVVSLEQPISVGEQHTLRVFARNRSSASATNVQTRFFIPAELEVVSAQGPAQYVQKGNQIIFSPVPEVKKGMQAIYDLTLKAKQSGKARVRVDINADQFDRPVIRDEAISIIPAD